MLENFMNDPVDNHGVAYKQYDYKTGGDFVYCPHCGKKQFPVTDIKKKYYKDVKIDESGSTDGITLYPSPTPVIKNDTRYALITSNI